MDDFKLQEAQQGMNIIFKTQEEGLEMNEEQLRYQNAFIDEFESLTAEDREQINDEDYFRLVAIKNRNLSKLMIEEEKTGGDSKEMSAVKETLAQVEESLKRTGSLSAQSIVEVENCYKAAISSCKYYIETKKPRFEAGKMRKKMVYETLEYLEREILQLQEGARLFMENQTDGMTISSAQDLLVLAMIHDSKHSDPIDGIDESELTGARILSFEDFASIVASDSIASNEMVEYRNGALSSYKASDGLFSIILGENRSSIYNRQMKERLYEIVRERVGEDTDEATKFLKRFKKQIELTGARTSLGVRKSAIKNGLREAGLLGSPVERILAQNELAASTNNDALHASVEDTKIAEAVRDVFGQTDMDAQDRKRVAVSPTKADKLMFASRIKDVFDKARTAGLDIKTPKSAKIDELCNGNIVYVQSQIFEAVKRACSFVGNFSGDGNIDYDQVTRSEAFINTVSALVISKYISPSTESRSLWDEELENKIREQAIAIATSVGRCTSGDLMEKVARPTLKMGSDGLDDVIGRCYPRCKAWKADKESLKKGTALLKQVCDNLRDVQSLTAAGIERGLTADEKDLLRGAGTRLQNVMQDEESKKYIRFVVSEIEDSVYALAFHDAEALMSQSYNFDTSANAIASSIKDVAQYTERKKAKVDDYDEKLSKLSESSKRLFETIGSRQFASLLENPSDSVAADLKKFRDVLRRFSSGRAIIRNITVGNATFKIAQRPDNTLYFVAEGQALKLSSTAGQLAALIENDMMTHTEAYGDDYAREIFRGLDFDREHQGSYITSRNVAIKYLAGKLKEKDTFFTNVSTDLLRQWCIQMMHGNLQPEAVRTNISTIESTVYINGSETLELLHRYDDTEEARLERAQAEEAKRKRQSEEKVRVKAAAVVNVVAAPIYAGVDTAVKVYNSVSSFAKKKLGAITSRFGFGRRRSVAEETQVQGEQAQERLTAHSESATEAVATTQAAAVVNAQANRKITLTKGAMMVGAAKQAVSAWWHGKSKAEIMADAQKQTILLISDMFFTQETWLADEYASTPGKRMQEIIRKNFKTVELMASAESYVYEAIDELDLGKVEVDGKEEDTAEAKDVKSKIKEMIRSIVHLEDLKTAVDDESVESIAKFAALEDVTTSAVDSASSMVQNMILKETRDMFSDATTPREQVEIPENESVESQKRRLKKMIEDAASGGQGQGLFYRTIFENYFKSVSGIDKRAMLSSAFRSIATEGVDAVMGGYIKGAGPLMQKILQGIPLTGMSDTLRTALSDIKSKLSDIPEKVVKAELDDIKARSMGRITEIEIERSLGAASVGQAFMCRMKGPEFGQDGKPVVIKVLRPEVRNRMMREKQVLLWCASVADGNTQAFDKDMDYSAMEEIGGMQATYQGTLSRIEEELDLSLEAKNAEAGSVYDRGYTTVRSMKVDSVVEPTTNTLILEKAEGDTVDGYMRTTMEESERLMGRFFEKAHSGIWMKKGGYDLSQSGLKKQTIDELKKLSIEMRKRHTYLSQIAEQWVVEGIYGSGFYHGDLHAGNIMVSDKGATIIDYGNATILSEEQRKDVVKMVTAASIGSTDLFIESFHKLLENTSEEKYESKKDSLRTAFDEVLKLGDETVAGERIMVCLLKAQEIGIEVPPAIYNFSMSQMRLSNTLDESMSQIDDLEAKISQMEGLIAPGEASRGDIVDLMQSRSSLEVVAISQKLETKVSSPVVSTDDYIAKLRETDAREDEIFKGRYSDTYMMVEGFVMNIPFYLEPIKDTTKSPESRIHAIEQMTRPNTSIMIDLTQIGSVFDSAEEYIRLANLIMGITIENAVENCRQIEEIVNRLEESDSYKVHAIGFRYKQEYSASKTIGDILGEELSVEQKNEEIQSFTQGNSSKSRIIKGINSLSTCGYSSRQLNDIKREISDKIAGKNTEDAYAEAITVLTRLKTECDTKLATDEVELRRCLDSTADEARFSTEEYGYFRQNLLDPTQREYITARITEIRQDRTNLEQDIRERVGTTYDALMAAITSNAPDVKTKMLEFFGAYNAAITKLLVAMGRKKYADESAEKENPSSFVDIMANIIFSNLKSTARMLGTRNIWKYRKELQLSSI